MAEALIGLGANLGDRVGQLRRGLAVLADQGVTVREVSRFRETAPEGTTAQPCFVNAVARVETSWRPAQLLDCMLGIERRFGRRRPWPQAPRTLDLDLLWFAGSTSDEDFLRLPHPRMLERRFVLDPLAELLPRLRLQGRTAREHLAALD